jgi:hypothetical protein
MKLNGFVTLKTEYVINQSAIILVHIDELRKELKADLILKNRPKFESLNFFKRLFGAVKPEYTDEEIWELMYKESMKDFFAWSPTYYVKNYFSDLEESIKEVLAACKGVDEIMVNTNIAKLINRGSNF